MPIITSIKLQKNQKRANIYLDGEFGFGVDFDNLIKLGLKKEQELTGEEIEKIVKKTELQKRLNKLLKFATLRPRSEREINRWLKRKKVHQSLHEMLFNKLIHFGLIDDGKFAQWWVDQRQAFRPKSLRVLRQELIDKGIQKEVIDDVLEKAKINELKIAQQLLEKKSYRWKNLDKKKARQKMSDFLIRKGFGWEIIKEVLK